MTPKKNLTVDSYRYGSNDNNILCALLLKEFEGLLAVKSIQEQFGRDPLGKFGRQPTHWHMMQDHWPWVRLHSAVLETDDET